MPVNSIQSLEDQAIERASTAYFRRTGRLCYITHSRVTTRNEIVLADVNGEYARFKLIKKQGGEFSVKFVR